LTIVYVLGALPDLCGAVFAILEEHTLIGTTGWLMLVFPGSLE
jgi:hypothetical protein